MTPLISYRCGLFLAAVTALSLSGCGSAGVNPVSQNTIATGSPAQAVTRTVQMSPAEVASLEVSLPAPDPALAGQPDIPAVSPATDFIPFSQRFVVINGITFAGDHLLVRFKSTTSADAIRSTLSSNHLEVTGYLAGIHWYVAAIPADADVITAARSLQANPLVEQAGLDLMLTPAQVVP